MAHRRRFGGLQRVWFDGKRIGLDGAQRRGLGCPVGGTQRRELGLWIIVNALRLLGDLAGETRPRGGETALVSAGLASPALVRDMLGEDLPPYIRHPGHDVCHGHELDLPRVSNDRGNDGPPQWVTQRWGGLSGAWPFRVHNHPYQAYPVHTWSTEAREGCMG